MTDPDDTVRAEGEPAAASGAASAATPPAATPAPPAANPAASGFPHRSGAGQPTGGGATSVPRQAEKETAVSRSPAVGGDEEPTVSLAGREPVVPRSEAVAGEVAALRPEDEPTVSLAGRPVAASGAVRSPEAPDRSGAGDQGPAAPVPEGDLDLGTDGRKAAGEVSGVSPDPSISVPEAGRESDLDRPARRRPAPAGTLIWVLLALLGFTLVVQLRSNDADEGLSAMRQEDLVRILSDLEAQDSRLLAEIQTLEQSKQQLSSQVGGKEAARAEAERRSQELGLLAGTERGSGPGLDITLSDVDASDVLNTVQELRGAGGEVMQLNGANGAAVRVVASSFFVDASGGGIIADGERLTGPFRLLVIGPAGTMSTALQIPGGVVASAKSDGGSVTMDSRSLVEVTAVRKAAALRYARPVS